MFQFRRFPTYAYLIQRTLTEYCSAGFPHSEIRGLTLMCSSPRLIAACHVLLRLLMPRHSPCALCSLTSPAPASSPSSPLPGIRIQLRRASTLKTSFSEFLVLKELCRPQFGSIVVCVTLNCLSPQSLLCYLSVACSQFLACFTVQFSRCILWSKTRLKCSDRCPNTSIRPWWRLPDSNR